MSDITYIYQVRPGENEELIYSLRTVHKNMPPGDIVIAGHLPDGITNVNWVPVEKGQNEPAHRHAWRALREAVDAVHGDAVMMNDDFMVLKRQETIKPYHRGTMAEMMRRYRNPGNAWAGRLHKVAAMIPDSAKCFEGHTPFPVVTEELRQTLDWMETLQSPHLLQWRTIHGHMHGWRYKDADFYPDMKARDGVWMPPEEAFYMSTLDTVFADKAVESTKMIRSTFDTPSPYEDPNPTRRARIVSVRTPVLASDAVAP